MKNCTNFTKIFVHRKWVRSPLWIILYLFNSLIFLPQRSALSWNRVQEEHKCTHILSEQIERKCMSYRQKKYNCFPQSKSNNYLSCFLKERIGDLEGRKNLECWKNWNDEECLCDKENHIMQVHINHDTDFVFSF